MARHLSEPCPTGCKAPLNSTSASRQINCLRDECRMTFAKWRKADARSSFGGFSMNLQNQMVRYWMAFAGVVLAATVLAGCASSRLPAAPATIEGTDYNYVVGAGDSLNVIVWRNPELSMVVPVRPDGKISTPLIDDLMAQGKNSVEIARDIEKQLGKYVRDPVVTVIVTSFVGPYSEQIRVVGEAAKPQFLPYKQKMTLLDVMIAVGGLTDFAAGNDATILRTAEGTGKQYLIYIYMLGYQFFGCFYSVHFFYSYVIFLRVHRLAGCYKVGYVAAFLHLYMKHMFFLQPLGVADNVCEYECAAKAV